MGLLKKKKKKNIARGDFATAVMQQHVVPTTIYSRHDAIGFLVKERGTIFGNFKRGKPLKF